MKWIDLNDKTGARLKSGPVDGVNFLWIVGLSNTHPRWRAAVEQLGFTETRTKKYLLRPVGPADKRLSAASFHSVWPDAFINDNMTAEQVLLSVKAPASKAAEQSPDERALQIELQNATLLGRNVDGDQVYQKLTGRFIHRGDRGIAHETPALQPAMFLYAPDAEALDLAADGFVRSMLMGAQRSEDFQRFMAAVNTPQGKPLIHEFTQAMRDSAHEVIDAAVMRHLTSAHATPTDAYGDANRLYDFMPPYQGGARGKGAMPLPLSIIAQRLLGDTDHKTVVLPNAFDGAAFAFLSPDSLIRAFKGKRDLSSRAAGLARPGLTWLDEFHHARESNAEAMFFNADPMVGADGNRADYRDALLAVRSLAPNGRAVLVLAADYAERPGEFSTQGRRFFERLDQDYEVEDAFDVGREMTTRVGTEAALRLVSLRNRRPVGERTVRPTLPVCHGWDEIKTRVDETLARAAVREQEVADGIDLSLQVEENKLQRPYIAFSKAGEASTMVPKELQAPLQAFFSEFEAQNGPIDDFVERELGFGQNTLAQSFSPEQVDGIGMMISRFKRGVGHILADETGIGKGRQLMASAVWALKQGKKVIFMTNGAHLFSDAARDLSDVGEWGRVRPFVMNADGEIRDMIGDGRTLAQGTPVAEMRRILADNASLEQLNANMVFTTYSQVFKAESEKGVWLTNQLADALLILDEAHVAAGSDSNIAAQICEMAQLAWNVQYASGTYLTDPASLPIYGRALPGSINVATLAQTMRRGGEAFSEIFSSMLAREGVMIRREHDLSKLEFMVEVDHVNHDRNVKVADQVSEIMGTMAYVAGDLRRLVTRLSDVNIHALRDARDARESGRRTSVFKSNFGTGSMLYQVHRRVNAALNVENAIRLTLEGQAADRKQVIVFEDTGEAFVKQAMLRQARPGPDGKLVMPELVRAPTTKDLLLRMLDTLQLVKVEDVGIEDLPDLDEPEAVEGEVIETDEEGVPLVQEGDDAAVPAAARRNAVARGADAEAAIDVVAQVEAAVQAGDADTPEVVATTRKRKKAFRMVPFWELPDVSAEDAQAFRLGMDQLVEQINKMTEIPLNAADEITQRLEAHGLRVGELSGRSFRLRPVEGEGVAETGRSASAAGRLCRVVPRAKGKPAMNETVRAFNGGDIDVVLINRSAATGISLHASPRFADQRRRQLIEIQIPENVRDRMQLYGRVNRFDQVSPPLIQIAATGNFGELRQIMVQNKKLSELSANVRSSRDNHALVKAIPDDQNPDGREIPDLLNVIGREVCRVFMLENPDVTNKLDVQLKMLEDKHRDFSHLLTSRIPLLPSELQRSTYDQLYALFDDAVLQAELSGENPLKPRELDVRATVSDRKLLFGFDHKGLGSAFDGAVFAERLEWKEDVRPLPLESIEAIVSANRERLLEAGMAGKIGERVNGKPQVDLGPWTQKLLEKFDQKLRLSLRGTQFPTVADALAQAVTPAGQDDPALKAIKRMSYRAKWLAEYLPQLVPGRVVRITLPRDERDTWQMWRTAVVLDIVPPPQVRDITQLPRWRVLTIAPGESKARSSSLHALMGEIDFQGERHLLNGTVAAPAYVSKGIAIGSDFMTVVDTPPDPNNRAAFDWLYENFTTAFVGTRTREAVVLTGNMYLASEWASQTKAGKGVIYTDDRGRRQRGVLLEQKFRPEWLSALPVRLWTRSMIHGFVDRLLDPESALPRGVTGFKVHTSFNAAWSAVRNERDRAKSATGEMHIIPGVGVVLNVGLKGRNRVNAMLRQAQKKIKETVFDGAKVRPADDPGHVTLKEPNTKTTRTRLARQAAEEGRAAETLTRGESHLVVLQANTPEKLHRAIDMLVSGPGLELYAPGRSELGAVAKECVRDFFVGQLRASAAGDAVREERVHELVQADLHGPGVADDTGDEAELRALFAQLAEEEAAAPVRGVQQDLGFVGGSFEPPPPLQVVADEETVDAEPNLAALFGTLHPAPAAAAEAAGEDGAARPRMVA